MTPRLVCGMVYVVQQSRDTVWPYWVLLRHCLRKGTRESKSRGWGRGRESSDWLITEIDGVFFPPEIKWDIFHSRIKESEFFLLLLFKIKVVYLKRLSDHLILSVNVGMSGKWLPECWGRVITLKSMMASTWKEDLVQCKDGLFKGWFFCVGVLFFKPQNPLCFRIGVRICTWLSAVNFKEICLQQ